MLSVNVAQPSLFHCTLCCAVLKVICCNCLSNKIKLDLDIKHMETQILLCKLMLWSDGQKSQWQQSPSIHLLYWFTLLVVIFPRKCWAQGTPATISLVVLSTESVTFDHGQTWREEWKRGREEWRGREEESRKGDKEMDGLERGEEMRRGKEGICLSTPTVRL